MLFDLLLIALTTLLFYFYIKNRIELQKLKSTIKAEQHDKINIEKFSAGLAELDAEAQRSASRDSLTGLPSREVYQDRLQQTIIHSKRYKETFVVMLLNINNFKDFNEKNGTHISDKILLEASRRLQKSIRQLDTVSRFAGDNFIFLLPIISMAETAVYVAQRLLDSLMEPYFIEGKSYSITANIGASTYPLDGETPNALINNANNALQKSKEFGIGKYSFHNQKIQNLSQRELAIHTILSNVNATDKLKIFYQSQINTQKNNVETLHATPFLNLPDFGEISYNEFIKIAENKNKVIMIGEWLLRKAITQFLILEKSGSPPSQLFIAVTLHQLQNDQFLRNIKIICEELNFSPKKIIFQVVETQVFSKSNLVEKTFVTLGSMGIQIAINVVSLGRFALHSITKLPINFLIINAKFIHDVQNQTNEDNVMNMIIHLAKDMNVLIIAEDVKNEQQKTALENIGCHIMEGSLFGDPMPIDAYMTKTH